MKKKNLLLFSLVILCIPLIHAQVYNKSTTRSYSCTYSPSTTPEEFLKSAEVKAWIGAFDIEFSNGTKVTLNNGGSISRGSLSQSFTIKWNDYVELIKNGRNSLINCSTIPGFVANPSVGVNTYYDVTTTYSGSVATISFYGINAAGNETLIESFSGNSTSSFTFSQSQYTLLQKFGKIAVKLSYFSFPQNTNFDLTAFNFSSFQYEQTPVSDTGDYGMILSYSYCYPYTPVMKITTSRDEILTISGEPDTKISSLQETGGHSSDHALNISQSGSGVVVLTQCNLSSLLVSLVNVDFACQAVTNLVLQDASGAVKKTFTTADYSIVGKNQIQLSLSNVIGIADNDKLQIALTNSCTTNHESDFTIVLSTEGKDQNGSTYINTELFPGGVTKVPIAITQKSGTKWCDNSSTFFFDVSGPNGYTNINFSNATPAGASFSVDKGQAAILGTANFYKCLTGVNIPVPATKMPKTPVIADLQYCDGSNFNLPITNPSDYTTETFRLLLDGSEKVGWQGTKSFSGINLAKVGSASAVVEANSGECIIASNTATINSRIQPIALAFNGSLLYYTEQVNTTIVQTSQQDGVTYKIYKDGSATPQDTWIGIKAQTLTKGSYRITAKNANSNCSAETNLVITEKDLNMGTAWTTDELSFCQLAGTKDLNSFVSFNGASSVVFTSTAGLSITGSNVNLAASTPATYTITCTAVKDGVTKVFTKDFTIKPKANDVSIALLNPTDFACNTDKAQLQVTTDYPGYSYDWSKNNNEFVTNAQIRTVTLPLVKEDGQTTFYVVPYAANGCAGNKSVGVTLKKNYLTADINFTTGIKTFCQSIAGTANIFDDLTGSDRIAVSLEQSGWTYNVTTSSSDMILLNRNQIDLERSKAGTYTITMAYSQNGCTKTITKQYSIKQIPSNVTVTLDNASTIECDLINANAQVHASNSNYTYNWTKNGVALTDNTQAVSIPVSKADGLTTIYAHPVLDGCVGLKSNEVSLTKRYVVADVTFSTGVTEYCQKTGGSIDIFTELSGTDKIAVVNSQSGYTWSLSPSGTGLKLTGSTINLETSQAGTYTVTLTISKDGCSKSITKDVMIRMRPADFTIALTNSTDFACNNSNAEMAASVTSYSYKWYKAGADAGTGTTNSIPVAKTDITDASRTIFAIGTAANTCETNPSSSIIAPLKTYLEADLSISSGAASLCQSTIPATSDVFDFLSGADKLAVTTNQHYTWSVSAPGLILTSTNHHIDLFKSNPGSYTVSFTYKNDQNCSKTLTKQINIKPYPSQVGITLKNAATIDCDMNNVDALLDASNGNVGYKWFANDVLHPEYSTYSINMYVPKGVATTIYAIPVSDDGCVGDPSNSVVINKRFIEAKLDLISTSPAEVCQTVGQVLDARTLVKGSDLNTVFNSQNGYTWDMKYSATGMLFNDTQNSIINLEKSYAQTYTSSLNIYRNGCSRTFNKEIKIKPRPIDGEILLLNPDNISCNTDDVKFKASVTKYSYNWFKNSTKLSETTSNLTLPILKTDGLVSVSAEPILDGCIGVKSNTINVQKLFVDANFQFSSGTSAWCQKKDATVDLFTEISGTDKLAIQQKQNGWNWSISSANLAGLGYSGSLINLETSKAGYYNINFILTKDGCSKTFVKSISIKQMPLPVTISLQNAGTVECDLSNSNALLIGDNKDYIYNWYKKGELLTDNTQSVSIPVSKADGATSIYAVPQLGYCLGDATNSVVVKKRFIEADLKFIDGAASYCQYPAKKVDLFTELSGTDKLSIQDKQNGWEWSFTGSTPDLVIDGSEINLETSKPGSYSVSMTITKDGCSKTLTKSVVVKAQPSNVAIVLQNSATIECDLTNPNALVKAENSAYSYNWYKKGTLLTDNTQLVSIPVSKADGATSIYAVPVLAGCLGLKTNEVSVTKRYVEANLAFSANVASYCQYPGNKIDLFNELSGTDKVVIQQKQNGYDWSFTSSTPDLVIVGSEINLETSQAGTYTVTMTISKDGCSKTITKSVVIKAIPSNVVVTLDNASTVECDLTNTNALVYADNTAYTYNWSKNGTPLIGSTQKMSIPVAKADGLTTISAIPVLKGCVGLKSNDVTLTKRFVEADFGFNNTPITLASKDEAVNLFDYTVGKDKDAIINQKSGYTYSINFTPIKQTTIATTDGTVVPASGLQTGDTKYTLNVIVSKDGCSKTLSKEAIIQSIPRNITIDFATKKDVQECTSNNYISVVASNSTLKYKWYKNDILVPGDTYQATIEVFKSDKEVKIYAIPSTTEGVAGYKTNDLLTTKRYVTADVQLDSKKESFCSVAGKKVNIFDYVRGADKAAVLGGQYGYTYQTSGDCGLVVAENKYIDFDNSLSEDNAVYNVSLTVAQNGCTSTQTKSITILRRPEDITIELLSKASNTAIKNMYCAGDSLELKASTSATNATYNWYKGTELITKTTVPSLKYKFVDPTGTINLSATSVFENGCQSTASNVVTVQKKDVTFNIDMATDPIAYCPEAKKINLFDYVSGNDKTDVMNQNNNCSYVFSASGNNGLAISSYSFLDLDNSTYSSNPYSLTFDVNKQGCVKSFTRQISIKPRPVTPLVALTSNSELRYCGGDVVTLTDKNAQTGTFYKWTVNGTDIAGSSSSILKYTTDQVSEIGVQAISYFNSNSCPSKASDVIKVSNVVPKVDIKLINTSVTVNDLVQFYVFESSTPSKNITLKATRISDKTVSDLPYTREGNVITLSGVLPIGEYEFSGVAENALSGYCSQNIVIANTLIVKNSTKEASSGVNLVSSSDEIARKTIYDEYMAQLKKGEVHSILLPILTASYEPAKLSVFTTDEDESVIIRIVDIQGHVISSRTEFLLKGENDFTIKGDDKPVVPGMYLINIDYSKAHKSETLKGLVK